MTQVVGNVGKKDLVHSGQTGLGDTDLAAAHFIADGIFNFPGP